MYAVTLAELRDLGENIEPTNVASAVASLRSSKHLLLNGGAKRMRLALARGLAAAAVASGLANGWLEIRVEGDAPAGWGSKLAEDASALSLWLVVEAIDMWSFAESGIATALLSCPDLRVLATAGGRSRQPDSPEWPRFRPRFAWVEVSQGP